MKLRTLSACIVLAFLAGGCSPTYLLKVKVVSAGTKQPVEGASFTVIPYISMFQSAASVKPNRFLGRSDHLGEFEVKLWTKDGILIEATGYEDANFGYHGHGLIGVNSPWTPSKWDGPFPASVTHDRHQQIVIPLVPNPSK